MKQVNSSDAWRPIAQLLSDGQAHPGLVGVFPSSSAQYSLLDSLCSPRVAADSAQLRHGEQLRSSLDGTLQQLAVFDSIRRCPILAITGLLNAGKSSLLSSFLSPPNRSRVLRGLANNAGTHRFVLWLPQVWRQEPEMLNTLISFLASVCGHPPEELSDDPDTAALQYNGRVLSNALLIPSGGLGASLSNSVDPLQVPLIAYDSGLDRLRVGLADCPDIQTGFIDAAPRAIRGDNQWAHAGVGAQGVDSKAIDSQAIDTHGEQLADQRRIHLQRMGRICSAFVVVSKMSSLHDDSLLRILTTLRDAVPGVPRFLAVNKIKARYAPSVVIEESQGVMERFGIGRLYVAYDYRSSLASRWIPPKPNGIDLEPDEQLPIFFEPSRQSQPSTSAIASASAPPALRQSTDQVEYLFDLGKHLDVGVLARESSRSLCVQLKNHTLQAIEWLEANQRFRRTKLVDAWQAVASACFEVMAERDQQGTVVGLRMQASPSIVAQLADGLQRTAPLWMQPSLRIDKTARQLHQAVANSASRFAILQSASDSVAKFTRRFRRGDGASVLTRDSLAASIRSYDRHEALVNFGQEALLNACNAAMLRFAAEDNTALDQQDLDQWGRQVWKQMSFRDKLRRGTQPLALLLGPLLAAVLIPIDAGGTAVLVFASTQELLAAAGIATLLTPLGTGGEALSIVQRETPWRQLGDLFAIVCDAIGLPRPRPEQMPTAACDGKPRQLAVSNVERSIHSDRIAYYEWKLVPDVLDSLQLALQKLVI